MAEAAREAQNSPAAEMVPSTPTKETDDLLAIKMKDAAEDAIRGKLRDPSSAVFSNEQVMTGGGATVACGTVNAKNGFGGMDGAERFISNGQLAFLESETEAGGMDQVWSRFCSG